MRLSIFGVLLIVFSGWLYKSRTQMSVSGRLTSDSGAWASVSVRRLYDFGNALYDFGMWTSKLGRLETFIVKLGQLALRLWLDTRGLGGLFNGPCHTIETNPSAAR